MQAIKKALYDFALNPVPLCPSLFSSFSLRLSPSPSIDFESKLIMYDCFYILISSLNLINIIYVRLHNLRDAVKRPENCENINIDITLR